MYLKPRPLVKHQCLAALIYIYIYHMVLQHLQPQRIGIGNAAAHCHQEPVRGNMVTDDCSGLQRAPKFRLGFGRAPNVTSGFGTHWPLKPKPAAALTDQSSRLQRSSMHETFPPTTNALINMPATAANHVALQEQQCPDLVWLWVTRLAGYISRHELTDSAQAHAAFQSFSHGYLPTILKEYFDQKSWGEHASMRRWSPRSRKSPPTSHCLQLQLLWRQ